MPPVKAKPIDEQAERDAIIRTAASDVRLLISYVSRRPRSETKELDLSGVVADRVLRKEYSDADELLLWKQLSELSAAAHPASANSIRDSKYYAAVSGKDAEGTDRGRSRDNVGVLALLVFLFALLIGGYTQVTNAAIAGLEADLGERGQLAAGKLADTRLASIEGNTSLPDAQRNLALYNAHREVQSEIRGGFGVLWPANRFANPLTGEAIKAPDGNSFDLYNNVVIEIQKNINILLSDFLVPALASFLGVAVFIIRDTTLRLESVSLSPLEEAAYWPRIILGMIAGLSIGWLVPPLGDSPLTTGATDGTVGFASLSKTALAFVVGYSVEVLLNVLDAIKSALGVKDEKL